MVIFDLVLDEPHRQAGLFDPRRNDDNLRLLNVALTRARRRLIVLGDFNWVEQHANRQAHRCASWCTSCASTTRS